MEDFDFLKDMPSERLNALFMAYDAHTVAQMQQRDLLVTVLNQAFEEFAEKKDLVSFCARWKDIGQQFSDATTFVWQHFETTRNAIIEDCERAQRANAH